MSAFNASSSRLQSKLATHILSFIKRGAEIIITPSILRDVKILINRDAVIVLEVQRYRLLLSKIMFEVLGGYPSNIHHYTMS